MELIKNNTRALLLVALVMMSTTLLSCHAGSTKPIPLNLCVRLASCEKGHESEEACRNHCSFFEFKKSHCEPVNGGSCCCSN
uniref:Knottin scorpion toxin-like domain-containing protein n=1 Tax=Aegilops tauschii subsp. strangulata TaxID=200361 RepID=A0A453DUC5_AEGTS